MLYGWVGEWVGGWKDGLTAEKIREHVGSASMVTDTSYLQMGPGMESVTELAAFEMGLEGGEEGAILVSYIVPTRTLVRTYLNKMVSEGNRM